jgi:hypothetical protein
MRVAAGLVETPLRKRLADAEPARGRMPLALRFRKPADPAATNIVLAMAAEDVVDEIDQFERPIEMLAGSGPGVKREQHPHREGVGPEIAPSRIATAIETGAVCEGPHQVRGELESIVGHGAGAPTASCAAIRSPTKHRHRAAADEGKHTAFAARQH